MARVEIKLVYLLLWFIYGINSSLQNDDVPCPGFCSCNHVEAKAMCSSIVPTKSNLTYIPRVPNYVTWFYFTGNRFPRVTRETLVNLTFNPILRLTLQQSKIRYIAPDAFKDLQYLTHLDINQNPKLSPEMFSKFLPSLNQSLITKLYFENNNWKHLSERMFHGLNESNLTSLSFEKNDLTVFDGNIFSNLNNLQNISFRKNSDLNEISLKGIPSSLTKLDLSQCNLNVMPNFCDGNKSLVPSIISINLQHNHISSIYADSFKCLGHLKEIKLDGNNIQTLRNNTFKHLSFIERVSLSNQHGFLKHIYKLAFNSSTLMKLSIANNGFRIRIPYLFMKSPKLKHLNLENNPLSLDVNQIRDTFLPLKKLEVLNLQNVGLRVLPPDLFPNMPSLKSLLLTKNGITGWNDNPSIFGNITWLKKLMFTQNRIKIINRTSFPAKMLSELSHIDFSNNQFACSCELKWFRDWIRRNETKHRLLNWPGGYKCRYPPEMNGKLLQNYNPTIESCKETNPLITIVISLCTVGGIAVIIISILYKSRWHIRYWIYLLRAKREGYGVIEGDNDFSYDGFVVYCAEDREWVHEKLIPKIEKANGYNLCVHYRDFDVGKLIVDNIVECMNKSRKIIVVLSNAFACSEWCQFELRVSQNRFLKADSGVLVLVMLEEINNKHLTSSLKTIITTTTYATWTEGGVGEIQFWDQLITALAK